MHNGGVPPQSIRVGRCASGSALGTSGSFVTRAGKKVVGNRTESLGQAFLKGAVPALSIRVGRSLRSALGTSGSFVTRAGKKVAGKQNGKFRSSLFKGRSACALNSRWSLAALRSGHIGKLRNSRREETHRET